MSTGTSEKIDLLIYGPRKPVVDNGFSERFVRHNFETKGDLDRLTPEIAEKIRGIAVTGLRPADKTVLSRFSKLEIVSSFGVGYDHVDSAYARDHGIIVTNTPDVLTEEVADTAVGLLISVLREFIKADRYLRSGLWTTQDYPLSVGSLRDRKVGMVGMGRIGQAMARRAVGFGMTVIYAGGHGEHRRVALDELFREADVISLHCPLTPETRHIVNARTLALVKPSAILVNTARGECIDEAALLDALAQRRIFGAGLDVFEGEPLVDARLRADPRLVLAPHIGSATTEARTSMAQLCADAVIAVLSGRRPTNLVNREVVLRG